jgi:hypothetical protein
MDGAHRFAMRLTQAGVVLSAARSIVPPAAMRTASDGADSPTPNAWAALVGDGAAEAEGEATEGEASVDAPGPGETAAGAVGVEDGPGVEDGVGAGVDTGVVGPGMNASSPPTTSPPAMTPISRPAAIAVLPPIGRERTSTNGGPAGYLGVPYDPPT